MSQSVSCPVVRLGLGLLYRVILWNPLSLPRHAKKGLYKTCKSNPLGRPSCLRVCLAYRSIDGQHGKLGLNHRQQTIDPLPCSLYVEIKYWQLYHINLYPVWLKPCSLHDVSDNNVLIIIIIHSILSTIRYNFSVTSCYIHFHPSFLTDFDD